MQGQAIVGEDDDEKDEVDGEVEHVGDELQVEDIDALLLPTALHVVVDGGQHIFDEGADNDGGLDDILKGKEQVHRGAALQGLAHCVLETHHVDALHPSQHEIFWPNSDFCKVTPPQLSPSKHMLGPAPLTPKTSLAVMCSCLKSE